MSEQEQAWEYIGQRRIKINNDTLEDTFVGYNYKNSEFFIENKGTRTTRKTAEEVEAILKVLCNFEEGKYPTADDLTTELVEQAELLQEVTYTYSNTDAYIKTLQFNEHAENPLTLDLPSHTLYVMNSDLIFDLSLNESISYRLPVLIQYYEHTLGLTIGLHQMEAIYNFIISYYNPYVQLQIQPRESTAETLWYTTTFKLLNYNKLSPVELTCTFNPYDRYELPTTKLADIKTINQNTNTIHLTSAIPPSLQVEDIITIDNSDVQIENVPYSDNGTYTITGLDKEANIIQVKEQFAVAFEVERKELYKVQSKEQISNISRQAFTITLTNSIPNTYTVGDILTVIGTQTTEDGENVSADGDYIIAKLDNLTNTITVSQQIPIDFTGSTAYVYKKLPLGLITSIDAEAITLDTEPKYSLTSTDYVQVQDDTALYKVSTVAPVSGSENYVITLTNPYPLPYSVPYAQLYEPKPQTWVNVEVTSSTNTNIPTGSFMVDNLEQCTEYMLTMFPNEQDVMRTYIATSMDYILNLSGYPNKEILPKRVPLVTEIAGLTGVTWKCYGLYDERYTE